MAERAAFNYQNVVDQAAIYDLVVQTPLMVAQKLSQALGQKILFKREELQPVFSFKIRGAFLKLSSIDPAIRARGVITASAGNHAQGLAYSARHLGCPALIVMPVTTPQVKINAVAQYGGQIELHGESYSDAYAHALQLQQQKNLTFVHPFDDPLVIAGQATVAREILQQHREPIGAIFVPIGGGGLAAGVAAYIKSVAPQIKVIGVQTEDSSAMYQSRLAGHAVVLNEVGLFSDGTAVKKVGDETLRLVTKYIDDIILVSNDALCAAILDAYNENRMVLEPAGALAIAGVRQWVQQHGPMPDGAACVAIASGANMNFDRLRFVAERAELGDAREGVFAVTMPEERGSFLRFCQLLGGRQLTEFNYRMGAESVAHVFVGLATRNRQDQQALLHMLTQAGFETLDLSQDELAKLHLRHLVGGKNHQVDNERLFRFEFPERPGALLHFLSQMAPNWNVSLFHYRNHGADIGRVLIGLQVPPTDDLFFTEFLQQMQGKGYFAVDETHNPAYRLFL